jgi:hypothetical protein
MILWQGRSAFPVDDEIFLAITGLDRPSRNPKTGPMIQAWILPRHENPYLSVARGHDTAVCGSCPLRAIGKNRFERRCYVNVAKAPFAVYRRLKAHRFTETGRIRDLPQGLKIRLGAYGDPAAVPYDVIAELCQHGRHTGYTHAWRFCDPGFKRLLMASVESPAAAETAQKLGWRTFRVRKKGDAVLFPGEDQCLAAKEAGHQTTCSECLACDANHRNISLEAHGKKPW